MRSGVNPPVMAPIEAEYCVPYGLFQPPHETEEALLHESSLEPDEVAATTGTGVTLSVRIDEDTLCNDQNDGPEKKLNQLDESIDGRLTVSV
jgi:hypothetical protein